MGQCRCGATLAAPAALHIATSPGLSPQAAAWNHMESGSAGGTWISGLRAATVAVLDHRVRDAARLETAEAASIAAAHEARAENQRLREDTERLRAEIEAVRAQAAAAAADASESRLRSDELSA